MSTPTRLILLRHAEVEDKYHRIFGGRIDMEISARGREQAAALTKHLRHIKFDAIYASPMKRVQQTLAPLLHHGTPKPTILHDLREIDFGDWTGLTWEEVCVRHNIEPIQWLEVLDQGAVTNAEPIPAYRERVERCLRHITQNHPGQTVAVFCHGGIIRGLIASALGLPLAQTGSFSVEYASVTELKIHGTRYALETLNFIPLKIGK